MAVYTYGGDDSAVAIDVNRNILLGRKYEVYTAINGTKISAITDLSGANDPGYVTSFDPSKWGQSPPGRVAWSINSTQWPSVYLKAATGDWWGPFLANEVLPQVPAAIAQAAAASAAASAATSALGQISRTFASFATAGQMNGTADFGPALQAAVDSIPAGGRLVFPAGSLLWHSGATYCEMVGRPDIEIDFAGTRCIKTTSAGFYNIFNVNGAGVGYGSGVRGLTIKNGYFQGSFDDANTANLCLLAANHAQRVRVYDCEFVACQTGAGHVMDLAGCDDVIIKGCTWRGYKHTDQVPRAETVQIDTSRVAAGAGSPGNFDGLLCKNIHMEDCRFLPWTDPTTGIKWPAPNPLGSHSGREGQWYEDISATGIYIEDPVIDAADTATNPSGIAGDDRDTPYIRGIFHFTQVKGLRIQARVKSTNGLGSIRVVQVESADYGDLASGDPNTDTTLGAYAVPVVSEDINIDLYVEGMKGTDSTLNPIVDVTGVQNANTKNVRVKLGLEGGYKEAVYFNRVEDSEIDFVKCANTETGARLISCNNILVKGNMRNVNLPVRVDASHHITVGPFNGQHSTTQSAFVTGYNAPDRVVCIGINTTGWTNLYGGVIPTNHKEAGILGPAVPA